MKLWKVNPGEFFAKREDADKAFTRAKRKHTIVKLERWIVHGPMSASRCAKMANSDGWADEIIVVERWPNA